MNNEKLKRQLGISDRFAEASDHPTGKHLGHASESTLRRIYQRKPMEHEGL